MKQKLAAVKLLCFVGLLNNGNLFSQAFTPGGGVPAIVSPLAVPGEAFRINSTVITTSNFFTQYFGGALPSGTNGFGVGDGWISSGQILGGAQTITGYRVQRNGRTMAIGIDANASPATLDAFVQWGGNSTIGSDNLGKDVGDLLFRNFTSPTSATPVQVLRLKDNGKLVLGKLELSSNFLAEIDASNNSNISGGMFIDVKNITLSASPVGLLTSVSGTSGASGIIANANGGSAIGVQGNASGTGAGTVIGLLGIANGGSGIRYGVYGSSNGSGFAGYFAGNVFATGTITSSDEKLKTTIEAETGLQKLLQLKPVSFYYNKAAIADLKMPESFQHGFLAQDMEKVFPESVMEVKAPIFKTDTKTGEQMVERIETFKGINYTSLIAVLTKSIQEQQEMINTLQNDITALKNTQQLAKAANSGYTLSQNVPNPFSGTTIINYTLPASTERAILLITDLNGKMQQQYNLARGSNQQTISGNSLAAGIYLYSLVVNGSEVVSKRMVLTK